MRRGVVRAALVLAMALAASGCASRIIDSAQGVSSSCTGFVSSGACNEQVSAVAVRRPGAVSVDLQCTAAACDRTGGSGTAAVTMGDRTVRRDTFAYVGDPAPMPVPTCVGLAFDLCQRVARTQFDGMSPSKRVMSIAFTCRVLPCTATRGETDYIVRFADGSTEEGSTGWEGGPP